MKNVFFDRETFILQPHTIQFELKLFFDPNDEIIICDVGSCEGEDSVKYSRIFPNSKIFAFEPVPQNITYIKSNFKKYNLQNFKIYETVLADCDSEIILNVSSGNLTEYKFCDWDFGNKSSSIFSPKEHTKLINFISFENRIKVKSTKLKYFFSEESIINIDIMQLDVQGAELLVLKGAEEKINNIKVIWLEVSKVEFYEGQPLEKEVSKFMKKNGFMLIKNSLNGIQGDKLYVKTKFFGFLKCILIKIIILFRDFYLRIIERIISLFKIIIGISK